MIEVTNAHMAYDGDDVVKDVTLTLPDSGLTALIGPNGAGKSTLLCGIGRLMELRTGTITIDGVELSRWQPRELAKTMAVLRQDNFLTVRLTVAELVMLGRHPHSRGKTTSLDEEKVATALKRVNMTQFADRFLDELSGGQRQRAFVAMTLAQDAKYLLLDEPLAALDMRHARAMMRHLREVCDAQGVAVVIVIHDINTAAAYADRLVALREGKLVADGRPDEVLQPEVLRSIFDVETEVVHVGGRPVAVPVV